MVDGELEPVRADVRLEALERHPRPDRHLRGGEIDRIELLQAGETQDHLAVARRPAADHARVAALRHDCDTGGRTRGKHAGNLVWIAGTDDEERLAREPAGEVVLVARLHLGIGEHVRGADDPRQPLREGLCQAEQPQRAPCAFTPYSATRIWTRAGAS